MREPGFYWVRATDPHWEQEPHVAEWCKPVWSFHGVGFWKTAGNECDEPDDAFIPVSERLTPPAPTAPEEAAVLAAVREWFDAQYPPGFLHGPDDRALFAAEKARREKAGVEMPK